MGDLRKSRRNLRARRRIFRSDNELHEWIRKHLELNIPRAGVCAGHVGPFEYLRSAYFEPAQDVVVWAPRGGGKTRLGAVATVLDLLHKPGCSIRILGGSLEQSLRMWEYLVWDVERLKGKSDWKLAAERIRTAEGSVAAVLAQSERAVRGLRVQKLRCDEVELFDPKVWEAAQLVTKSRKKAPGERGFDVVSGVVEVFSTMHRPWGLMQKIVDAAQARGTPVFKWCLLEVLERCPQERCCATCPLHPECQGRAKTECNGFFAIDDAIAMKQRVSMETWEAEMLCLRPTTRGRVFPTFDRAVHVREAVALARESELWLGIDFGFSNPFVCLWVRKGDGVIHVIDEYVRAGQTTEQHVQEIQERNRGAVKYIGCDPAGTAANDQTARSNVAVLKHAGFAVRTRGSRIVEGLEMIRATLKSGTGQARLFVHPRCERLIRAMEAYRYPDSGGELPLKDGQHDHLIDALRYFFINSATEYTVQKRRY